MATGSQGGPAPTRPGSLLHVRNSVLLVCWFDATTHVCDGLFSDLEVFVVERSRGGIMDSCGTNLYCCENSTADTSCCGRHDVFSLDVISIFTTVGINRHPRRSLISG